jgi:hypothetical protein
MVCACRPCGVPEPVYGFGVINACFEEVLSWRARFQLLKSYTRHRR